MNQRVTTYAITTAIILLSSTISGCIWTDEEETIRIAFKIQDDYVDSEANPQKLADFIHEQSGYRVEIYPISSDLAAIESLRFGHADIAFLDGGSAWMSWKQHGFEAILADTKSDGSTYYTASAWVLVDSQIESLEDLEGMDSCHTGWLKSAGMLMPMGYMIGNEIIEVSGDNEDIDSLRTTIENHFGNATIPSSGDTYYGYSGAFRCLTDGQGDVAFAKTSSYIDHCQEYDWCLEQSEYRMLEQTFGKVPSHPVMINPNQLDMDKKSAIVEALLALNDNTDGLVILESVLNTAGLTSVNTDEHLGTYSDAISAIPGIEIYFEEKYG
ncbi:MAG TPA: PhnD/SsuA/transferrin family substrate-binding protein [Candidatus Thalassarchaeaceae archaeon]|jgi:melanoma-associated antigen p97|nr:PhnD/SsuA/transferrin family substrate-binding protein [Candidatus Thalassarchaeaceae archaeon]